MQTNPGYRMAIFADGLLDSASLHIGSLSAVSILELISRHTEYAAEASDALALLAGADMVHGHYASAQQRLTSAKSFATQLAGRRKNGAWATALYARVTKDAAAELAALREATGAIDKLEQGDDIYSFWRLADAEKAAGSFRDGYRTLQTLWKKLGELPAVPTDDLAESDLRLARAAFAAGEQEAAAIAARGLANAELVSGFLDPVRLSEAAAIIALAGDASGDPDASHWARLARWHAAAALFEEPRLRFLRSHELILANLAAKPAPGATVLRMRPLSRFHKRSRRRRRMAPSIRSRRRPLPPAFPTTISAALITRCLRLLICAPANRAPSMASNCGSWMRLRKLCGAAGRARVMISSRLPNSSGCRHRGGMSRLGSMRSSRAPVGRSPAAPCSSCAWVLHGSRLAIR